MRNSERLHIPLLSDESALLSSTSNLQYDNANTQIENPYAQNSRAHTTNQNHRSKRPLSSIEGPPSQESSVEEDTRSVALDLGLLSLHSDSRQLHYLGSSSGSLFASLVQAKRANDSNFGGSKGRASSQEVDDALRVGYESSSNPNLVQFDVMRAAISSLYAQLRKVRTCLSSNP